MLDSQEEIRAGDRFAFGSNWCAFIELVDEARIEVAIDSLRRSLEITDLSGRSFLDAGCGSGLFSLAARRLGARVRSFDLDRESVAATLELRRRFDHTDHTGYAGYAGYAVDRDGGEPDAQWQVELGSVLDKSFVEGLGRFDVVYSWGVLHHTGDLWTALDTVAGLVAPDGLLYVSIYNDQGLRSRVWRRVKRRYNKSGPVGRRALVAGSALCLGWRRPLLRLLRLGDPAARAQVKTPRARGMSVKHDLVDWVGG